MKTILLMNHAEAGWDQQKQDDWYRPLSNLGKMDAFQVGELLVDKALIPDLILASSAIRAQQTARIVANAFNFRTNLLSLDDLYLADMETYFTEIQKVSDKVQTLMVVGHNPCLSRLLQVITESVQMIAPSDVAHIALAIDTWKAFKYDTQGDIIQLIKVCSSLPVYQNERIMAGVRFSGS